MAIVTQSAMPQSVSAARRSPSNDGARALVPVDDAGPLSVVARLVFLAAFTAFTIGIAGAIALAVLTGSLTHAAG
jgi:hypothetical protein